MSEYHNKFVEQMLESSEKKFKGSKAHQPEVDTSEVENLTAEIQRRIQQR